MHPTYGRLAYAYGVRIWILNTYLFNVNEFYFLCWKAFFTSKKLNSMRFFKCISFQLLQRCFHMVFSHGRHWRDIKFLKQSTNRITKWVYWTTMFISFIPFSIKFNCISLQRLEQPECCPKEYYTLMLKCWQHDPSKRPKFCEIHSMLPDMKPEQLKTISTYSEAKKERLMYRQNDIITVLDKPNNSTYWKGVLNTGKTGMFNPSNTVAYLGNSLPSSVNRDSFVRGSERTSSRRKLCPEMISGPQNDLKHTGHVGLDGAYFGDVAFLSSSSNSQSVRNRTNVFIWNDRIN